MDGLKIKEAQGAVLIYGLSSQPVALRLRDRLKEHGFITSIGIIPGVQGYQVSVHAQELAEVKRALVKLGIGVEGE